MAGRIELITGPMYSGKTTELLRRKNSEGMLLLPVFVPPEITRLKVQKRKTHDGKAYLVKGSEDLKDDIEVIRRDWPKENVLLCIDEVQFFPPDVVPVIEKAAREWGWTVICAGLDRDFAGERWETTKKLADIADCVIRLRARCAICGALAERTQRLHLDGTPARADEPRVVLNDGSVRYEPRCWRCHQVG